MLKLISGIIVKSMGLSPFSHTGFFHLCCWTPHRWKSLPHHYQEVKGIGNKQVSTCACIYIALTRFQQLLENKKGFSTWYKKASLTVVWRLFTKP